MQGAGLYAEGQQRCGFAVDLGARGWHSATVWTCDLTHGYICDQCGLPLMKTVILVSAVALIDRDGRVLLAHSVPPVKSMAGLMGVSGRESGEVARPPKGALVRELHEELGIETWDSLSGDR